MEYKCRKCSSEYDSYCCWLQALSAHLPYIFTLKSALHVILILPFVFMIVKLGLLSVRRETYNLSFWKERVPIKCSHFHVIKADWNWWIFLKEVVCDLFIWSNVVMVVSCAGLVMKLKQRRKKVYKVTKLWKRNLLQNGSLTTNTILENNINMEVREADCENGGWWNCVSHIE